MRMTKNMRFWDFTQDVRALNIILRRTTSHMDNSMLHNQLEAGLEPALQAECSREGLCAVTALKDWIERVKKVDERLTFYRKRYREIFIEESAIRASKRPALGNSRLPNAPTANTLTYTSAASRDISFIRLPKLTDAERDLLRTHSGCFKCRRFNAGHGSSSPNCPGFPSGNGYTPITKFADSIGQAAGQAM